MNTTQLPFLVEGVLFLTAGILGGFLWKEGRPYGKVKLAFHLFFFLWLSVGYYFISTALFSNSVEEVTKLLLIIMGVALGVQLLSGIIMLFQKERKTWLAKVHGTSALLLLVVDIVLFFWTGTPS